MRLLCSLVLGSVLASCGSGGDGIRRTIVTDPIVQGYEAAGYWESVDGTRSLTVELFGSFATAIRHELHRHLERLHVGVPGSDALL